MTHIYVNRENLTIVAEGHAQYAAKGEDIVCAAISTVLQLLERYAGQGCLIAKGMGTLELCMLGVPGAEKVFDAAVDILTKIEEQYPENVYIEMG